MKLKRMNKKGDIPSILLIIVSLAIVGLIIFFISHVSDDFYSAFDNYFENSSAGLNDSTAHETLQKIQATNRSVWDFAFLGIVMGYFLALMLTMFSTRISPVFYWIYALVAIVGLVLATILSNIWQGAVENPEFAVTITRFPMMNTILGTYYPIFITVVIVLAMVLLFGKNPSEGGQ